MVLRLPANEGALRQTIGSKVRNQVKKGQSAGLTIRCGGPELVDRFYKIFAVNMRDLGTPVYSRKLFRCVLKHFGEDAELAVVEYENRPVAAVLLMHDRSRGSGSTQVISSNSLHRFNQTNANMWMYFHLLARAIRRGSSKFDFGRCSRDSGTYHFKKQWGSQPRPMTWQYHVRHGNVGTMRPDHPKMRRRITTWKKRPVWVTRVVGPAIVRGIP